MFEAVADDDEIEDEDEDNQNESDEDGMNALILTLCNKTPKLIVTLGVAHYSRKVITCS